MTTKIVLIFSIMFVLSCKKEVQVNDVEETAQQVGDVMASIDEAGGQGGSIASLENDIQRTFEKHAPNEVPTKSMMASLVLPEARAAGACYDSISSGFSSCSSVSGTPTVVRTFNSCTIGSATLSGDVTLAWSGAGCSLVSAGQNVKRTPNFTLTGRRGATLTVSKTGTFGQKITYMSGSGTSKVFELVNDGIRRKFTSSLGQTITDHTTTTQSAISMTGTSRSNRVLNGGVLRVTNNVSSNYCDFAPTNVTWSSTACNCPISGSWTATCLGGMSATIEITGCGTARYTEGSDVNDVTFDRCISSN